MSEITPILKLTKSLNKMALNYQEPTVYIAAA